MAPDRRITQKRLSGCKKAKKRTTIIPCANADGLEKIELMIFGSRWKRRAFKKIKGAQLGFYYHANKKAWMTAGLFTERLKRFQAYVAKTPGRIFCFLLKIAVYMGKKKRYRLRQGLRFFTCRRAVLLKYTQWIPVLLRPLEWDTNGYIWSEPWTILTLILKKIYSGCFNSYEFFF